MLKTGDTITIVTEDKVITCTITGIRDRDGAPDSETTLEIRTDGEWKRQSNPN